MPSPRLVIDPELAAALSQIPRGPSGVVFDLTDIDATRDVVRAFAERIAAELPDDPSVTIEEQVVPRHDGPDLPIRVVRPTASGSGPRPALLWFHGGGQVLGYAAQDDLYLKPLCAAIGCIAVSVDYRLAPEARSPAAAEDGYLAYEHVRRDAYTLGIDEARIGLAGASGGGCIAAATALIIRDRDAPPPLFQSLNYPMLDDRNVTTSSLEVTDVGIWDRATNLLAWEAILGEHARAENVSSYSAPARADDLAGLPATFIVVGEVDVFRDENLDYATRLRDAGVSVELHLYGGAYHAWDLFAPESQLATAFYQTWFNYLGRQFSR